MRKIADRHAPRPMNCCRTSGKRYVLKMRSTLEAFIASNQDFAAPYVSVGAVTGAIEGKADDLSFEMVFCHAAGNVRVMVLYADQRQFGFLQGPLCREVVRMKIIGDAFRHDLQHLLKVMNCLFKELEALEILEITNVLAEKGVLALRKADRVLQFASDRKDTGHFLMQKHRHGHKAARAPKLLELLLALLTLTGLVVRYALGILRSTCLLCALCDPSAISAVKSF